jgi:predicted O-methyltransferase YrrM
VNLNPIKAVARKMLGNRLRPVAPFAARDEIVTLLFSQDDETFRPSARLIEMAGQLIARASVVSLEAIATERPSIPPYYRTWPGEHYKLLAALMQVLQPKTVVEIGTYQGLSALTMLDFLPADSRLVTFDIIPWSQIPGTFLKQEDFDGGRLRQFTDDLAQEGAADRHRELLESADFLFIDGPHDGETERRMLANLQTLRFRNSPVLLFDDIHLVPMLKFWRDLPLPKMNFTSFGHWSGTGLAEWPSDTA